MVTPFGFDRVRPPQQTERAAQKSDTPTRSLSAKVRAAVRSFLSLPIDPATASSTSPTSPSTSPSLSPLSGRSVSSSPTPKRTVRFLPTENGPDETRDYGTEKRTTEEGVEYMKSLSYESAFRRRKAQKEGESAFAKLAKDESIKSDQIVRAFDQAFKTTGETRELIVGAFHSALQTLSEYVKRHGKDDTVVRLFKNSFLAAIEQGNTFRQMIDRDMFRDLMFGSKIGADGKLTAELRTKMASPLLSVRDPEIKKLIEEFEKNTWRPGENRLLQYALMNEKERELFNNRVDKFFADPQFLAALDKYLSLLHEGQNK